MNLYELAHNYNKALSFLETEEENADHIEIFEHLEGALEEKIINCIKFYKNKKAELEIYEKERKRLQDKEKSIKSAMEYIRSMLDYALEKTGKDKIKDVAGTVSYMQRDVPVVENEESIPDEYYNIIPEQRKLKNKEVLIRGIIDGNIQGKIEKEKSLVIRG